VTSSADISLGFLGARVRVAGCADMFLGVLGARVHATGCGIDLSVTFTFINSIPPTLMFANCLSSTL
jgi:hypothetical protein